MIFWDDTFYNAPKCVYQLFKTRVNSYKTNLYYSTSFSIMKRKNWRLLIIFYNLNLNIKKYLVLGDYYNIMEFNSDFEIVIGEACRKV